MSIWDKQEAVLFGAVGKLKSDDFVKQETEEDVLALRTRLGIDLI